MLQEKGYRLKSNASLLMHSGRLADPSNEIVKAMKTISGKRPKTEADHEELARLAFLGGLYMNENGPVIPAPNIRATLIAAARKSREGKLAESGLFILNPAELEYEGPRDPDEMWEDGSFTSRHMVSIQRNKVARIRPEFHDWEADVTIEYDDEIVSEDQLDKWFDVAGRVIGFCDWRPLHGRFTVLNGNGSK